MTDRHADPPEARPVETDEPSDLMAALVSGIEDAATTGRGLAVQLGALETNVARAHRRRTGLIVVGLIVAVLILLIGAAFLRLESAAREELRLLSDQNGAGLACTTPSHPPGESPPDAPPGFDGVHRCYEDRLLRTAAAVGRARDASIAVGQCVVDRAPDVRVCVEQTLAAGRPSDPRTEGAP